MQIHEISHHNTKFWVLDEIYADFDEAWFDQTQPERSVEKHNRQNGRQAVIRFTHNNASMILRHYCRGGLPAQLAEDQFVFYGYHACRSYQELNLLMVMQELGLPAPKPLAARCRRENVFYKADILMREIADTVTLTNMLLHTSLANEVWRKIGNTISLFHKQGVQHVDLNANNILIDIRGDVFLIDFDRCKQRIYSPSWARAGLQRLARSLKKEKALNPQMHYEESMFSFLEQGYME